MRHYFTSCLLIVAKAAEHDSHSHEDEGYGYSYNLPTYLYGNEDYGNFGFSYTGIRGKPAVYYDSPPVHEKLHEISSETSGVSTHNSYYSSSDSDSHSSSDEPPSSLSDSK